MTSLKINALEIDEFLLNSLKNPIDRRFILQIDKELALFIQDKNISEKILLNYNGYQRMIIHKIAHYFGLSHMYSHERDAVVVIKEEDTSVPVLRLHDFAEFPGEKKVQSREVKKVLRRTVVKREVKEVVKREENEEVDEVEEVSLESSSSEGDIEKRELAYEEARARIFEDFEVPEDDQEYKDIYEGESSEEVQTFEIPSDSPPVFNFNMKFNWNAADYKPSEIKNSEFQPTPGFSNYQASSSLWNPTRDPIHYENPNDQAVLDSAPSRYTSFQNDSRSPFQNNAFPQQQSWGNSFDPFDRSYADDTQKIRSSPSKKTTTRTMPLHMMEVQFKKTPTKPIFDEVKESLKRLGCRIKMLPNRTLIAIFKSATEAEQARAIPNKNFSLHPLEMMMIAGTSESELLPESHPENQDKKSESTYSYF